MEEEDVTSQLGWNELFQNFVSHLFTANEEESKSLERPHNVDELSKDGRHIGSILKTLEQSTDFVRSKYARDVLPPKLPASKHLSVLAEGLGSYITNACSKAQCQALSDDISSACLHWLSTFMRLPRTCQGVFSSTKGDALQLACRAALFSKCEGFASCGYLALRQQPVFYSTSKLNESSLARTLNLPIGSVRHCQGDADALRVLIVEDRQAGKRPFGVIASAGSRQMDDIRALRQLCQQHNMWLHVEGDDLALLLTFPPDHVAAVKAADSFSVNPGEWYGLTNPSTCTFFHDGLPLDVPQSDCELLALPLWITMQHVGQEQLSNIVSRSHVLAKEMASRLQKNESIHLYSGEESMSCVFRYIPITSPARPWDADSKFLDNLNKQLLIDLNATAEPLDLDVAIINNACCISFRPLQHSQVMSIDSHSIDCFTRSLETVTNCVNATLSAAPAFEEAIQRYAGLQCVHVPNFVGLGAIRFLPGILRGHELAEEVKAEIDDLNANLAEQLKASDSLFDQNRTTDGAVCVTLGIGNGKPRLLPELIDTVQETKQIDGTTVKDLAKIIDDCSKSLDIGKKVEENISKIVQDGIRNAESKLLQEQEENWNQQGIVRKLPLVGSVMNWWSPVQMESKGKSFDICSSALRDASYVPSPGRISTDRAPTRSGPVSSDSPRLSVDRSTSDTRRTSSDAHRSSMESHHSSTESSETRTSSEATAHIQELTTANEHEVVTTTSDEPHPPTELSVPEQSPRRADKDDDVEVEELPLEVTSNLPEDDIQ